MLPLFMIAREVIRIIKKDGWYFARQSSSHKIFKHPVKRGITVVPEHGKKDIKPGTLNSIFKQAQIK